MTITRALAELDGIRNNRHSDTRDLIERIDAIGSWAAGRKHSKGIARILEECHRLHDRLNGGSGRGGLRIELAD